MQTIEGEIQKLQEKLKQTPPSLLFARLADLHLRKKELAEAISICERGVQKHPNYVAGHFVLGKCYFEDGKLDQAESEFNRVLLYDPEHLGAFYYQARIMKARSWNNAYLLWLKRILEIDPLDSHAQALIEEYEAQTATEVEKVPPVELEQEVAQEKAMPPEPSEQEVKEIFGRFEEPEKAEEVKQEGIAPSEAEPVREEEVHEAVSEMDEEEKFSYILDDIFKNEVIDEEKLESIEKTVPPAGEEEIISAIREKVEGVEQEEETEEEIEEEEKGEEVPGKSVEAKEPESEEEAKLVEEAKSEKEPPPPKTQPPERKEPIVTPTLGEIYAAQGHFDKAIGVYEILLRKDPTNQTYIEKVEYLKKKLEESKGKED